MDFDVCILKKEWNISLFYGGRRNTIYDLKLDVVWNFKNRGALKEKNLMMPTSLHFQVYIQHMRNKQADRPRKLVLALKYKETRNFTKCFHGWGKHKEAPK